jgi:hypothetical protein
MTPDAAPATLNKADIIVDNVHTLFGWTNTGTHGFSTTWASKLKFYRHRGPVPRGSSNVWAVSSQRPRRERGCEAERLTPAKARCPERRSIGGRARRELCLRCCTNSRPTARRRVQGAIELHTEFSRPPGAKQLFGGRGDRHVRAGDHRTESGMRS